MAIKNGAIARDAQIQAHKLAFAYVDDATFVAAKGEAAEVADIYYNTTLLALRGHDGSSWSTLSNSGTGPGTIDDVLLRGAKATSLVDPFEIEHSANVNMLVLDKNGTGAGACILFENAGTGNDCTGSATTWTISAAGAAAFASVGLVDAKPLNIGTSSDVVVQWDGTNLIIAVAADDSLIEIGDSASPQLSTDIKWYGNGASGADYVYFDASANLVYFVGVDLQLKDNDVLAIGTGAGAAGDVSIVWDATNLIIKAAADDLLIEIGDSAATQLSFDLKWYGESASGASYVYADASANLIYTVGVDIQFKDSDYCVFGSGAGATGDVSIMWDATNLIIECVSADDLLIEIGNSAATQLSFDVKWYANEASGASYLYFDASANLIYTVGVDIQFKDNDVLALGTGAGAAGDISIVWDATNLIIKTAADDSLIEIGDSAATQLSVDLKWYANEASGASYVYFDASANIIYFVGVDLTFQDNDLLNFGTGASNAGDFKMYCDGTSLFIAEIVANGADIQIGVDGKGLDLKLFGETASAYILWDQSADDLLVGGVGNIRPAAATASAVVFCLQNTVAYTDTTNKTLGVIPANAKIVDVWVNVTTAFDDTGTDLLNVGSTSGDPDEWVDAASVAATGLVRAGSGATYPVDAFTIGASNVTVYGKYVGQNSNAAAGAANVCILYILP